jgi:hypothetical protein
VRAAILLPAVVVFSSWSARAQVVVRTSAGVGSSVVVVDSGDEPAVQGEVQPPPAAPEVPAG